MKALNTSNKKLNTFKSYASRIKRMATEIKVSGKCTEEKADTIFELSDQLEDFLIPKQ